MNDLLKLHKALADETRLRLVRILLSHELSVGELVSALSMGQSRISRHLRILVDAGLVECRREGQWVFYRVVQGGEPGASGRARRFLDCCAALMDEDHGPWRADLARAALVLRERAAATRRFFDAVAGRWQGLTAEALGGFDLHGEIAARVPEGAAVADLGCGPGELLTRLSGKACLLVGVDSAPRMLELAAQRLPGVPGVSLRLGDLAHLPLREGEVQVAVFSLVLHHLPDPVAALAEARRVLAPGGLVLVADFDRHDKEELREHPGARLGIDRRTLSGWLSQAGFEPGGISAHPASKGLTLLLAEAMKT